MANLKGFGIRSNIAVVTNGEDIWQGTASTIPTPSSSGEQMTLVSTSIQDASSGTGVQSVQVDYLDNNGASQSEIVTMNGIIGVDTVATNIIFVQQLHATSIGSNGAAAGTISIYKKGFSSTVYNVISPGGNDSLNTARMVPANNTLIIKSFTATGAISTVATELRLASTSFNGTLTPGIFHVIYTVFISNSSIHREFLSLAKIPALAIVKVIAYSLAIGQYCQSSWDGYTIV